MRKIISKKKRRKVTRRKVKFNSAISKMMRRYKK